MKLKLWTAASLAALLATGASYGAASVSWTSPADGSVFPAGTAVSPTGQASGIGSTGGGLDLALVLDSSGSMSGARNSAMKTAANALVNALSPGGTSVAIIDFDSDAFVVQPLTPVPNPAINNAINGIDASGGTNIATGINVAAAELTGPNHTAGRTQMMVVLSDGGSSISLAEAAADAAIAGGVDAVHSVGIPGHDPNVMRAIVNGVDDTFGTADDHGIYTNAGDLQTLINLFNGQGGNLVGLQQVDVTMPDGTVLTNVPTDAIGNFTVGPYALAIGPNVFTAVATATDGSTATATLTLYGRDPNSGGGGTGVPDGGATLILLGLALGGLSFAKKKLS